MGWGAWPGSSAIGDGVTVAVGGERKAVRATLHGRIWDGVWRARNWLQLARFGIVGLSGYVVNLTVFAVCAGSLRLHHLVAASLAFVAAVSNNFFWNRRWTFDARRGRARSQAARFLIVSLLAFLLAALILDLLVRWTELPVVIAQALSVTCATPINFLGNKVWTFARDQ
jgi:putative flippase GtrA